MKKIKYILSIGILGALFSSCFSYNSITSVEYFDSDNLHSQFIFGGNTYQLYSFGYNSANGGTISALNGVFWSGSNAINNDTLNISNYSLINSNYYNIYANSNLFVNNNNIALMFNSTRCDLGYCYNYLFQISNSISDINYLYSTNKNLYIRVQTNNGDGIIVDNPFAQTVSPNGVRSWIFDKQFVQDSNRGIIYDTLSAGTMYDRGVVVPGVGNQYSFTISPEYLITGNQIILDSDSIPYLFRTVSPTFQGDYIANNGIFITKLDTLYRKNNTGDFRILVISLTGNSSNFPALDFIYSRYTCSSDSLSYSDCTYYDGGYLRSSNLANSFISYNGVLYSLTGDSSNNNIMKNFLVFLTYNGLIASPTIYNIEATNIIQFYRPAFIGDDMTLLNYSLGLSPSAGINILDDYQDGGFSSYSGVASLGFDCVMTEVCWSSTGTDGNFYTYCGTTCVDSGVVESGSYIGSDGTIYYVDSNYNVGNISNSDGVIYDTGFLDEDGLLSVDYYSGLFNGNGFKFGVCPYPPSSYLNFATKIKLGNFYPFMPLNCFVSAFQQGVKVHYFDDSGLFPDNHSQLMAGDTHYHKTLFRFFDVLLSIGILLLLSALLRIIKK